MSVIVDGSNGLIFNDASTQTTAATGFGFKNRIINGAMVIDQRNAGNTVSIDGGAVFTVDRWQVEDGSDAVLSAQQSTDVPTGQGFINSLKVTVTTADTSIGPTQYDVITHYIEGLNSADLMFGSAAAQTVTLSFWVKSSVTGQYSATLVNSGGSRINPQAFTINAANTWEKKIITYTGDASGTWLTNGGRGVTIQIFLAEGSTYTGAAGWNGSSIYAVTGQVNFVGTVNNAIYLTGVQLEKGSTATSFDFREYGTELRLCQRYYEQSYPIGTTPGTATYVGCWTVGGGSTGSTTSFIGIVNPKFTVQKRAIPTITVYDPAGTSGVMQRWQLGVNNVNGQNAVVGSASATGFDCYSGSGSSSSGLVLQYKAEAEL